MTDTHRWRLSRRAALAGGAVIGAAASLGMPRMALAAPATPPKASFKITGLTRVNSLFGSNALLAVGARGEEDAPVLLAQSGRGGAWKVAGGPSGAATLADGAVLPDGRVVLVGTVRSTRRVDLTASMTEPGETAVFDRSDQHAAAWVGRPGGAWTLLKLGLDPVRQSLLTGVATHAGVTVAVGQFLDADGASSDQSFSVASSDGTRTWRSALFPMGPRREGGVLDVEWTEGSWLAAGFDIDSSLGFTSPNGLAWSPVAATAAAHDPATEVQEVSSSPDGSSVVLTTRRGDTTDTASTVVGKRSSRNVAPTRSNGPVFSMQAMDGGTAVVATASGSDVTIEEVSLVRD